MYAVVQTGGKQYRVSPGQVLEVEKLLGNPGEKLELPQVLLVADGEKVTVGNPTVPGAVVVATSLGEVLGEKVTIFKYKSKTRYRRKTGHRQPQTRLRVEEIRLGEKKRARRKKDGSQEGRGQLPEQPGQPGQEAGGKEV